MLSFIWGRGSKRKHGLFAKKKSPLDPKTTQWSVVSLKVQDSYLPLFRVRRHGEGPCGDPRDVGVYPCGGGDDPSYPSLFCGHPFPSLLALGILVPLPSGK